MQFASIREMINLLPLLVLVLVDITAMTGILIPLSSDEIAVQMLLVTFFAKGRQLLNSRYQCYSLVAPAPIIRCAQGYGEGAKNPRYRLRPWGAFSWPNSSMATSRRHRLQLSLFALVKRCGARKCVWMGKYEVQPRFRRASGR
jgi:hypothetical protein